MRGICSGTWPLKFLAMAALSAPATGFATAVTVNAGQSYIFNFDLVAAGASLLPPYTGGIVVIPNILAGTCCVGDAGTWTLFGDPDGIDAVVSFDITDGLESSGDSRLEDGIFSLGLTMTVGSVVVDPLAYGVVGTNLTGVRYPVSVIPPVNVSEPGSLLLLGLGLVALRARSKCQS